VSARENGIKNAGIKISKPFLSLAVFFWFWPSRWIVHNLFLFRLKNPKLKPSIWSLPFVYLSLAYIVLKNEFQRLFTQYALKKYIIFTQRHYSESGLGYFNFSGLNDHKRIEIYNQQKGRIIYFLDHNELLIPYKDGDTFLDAGCGKGQNIKAISERYPLSKINGFDISEQALQIIKCGVGENPNIKVETGDISDLQYLSSIPDASFDHIILSHVIGFLSGSTIEETLVLRQQIIDHLVRICSISVMILDVIEDVPNIRVEIEQKNRCIVHDRLMNYFLKHTTNGYGEMYIMFSDESGSLLYLKKSEVLRRKSSLVK
jgi:SAM-dependent methyltransferase